MSISKLPNAKCYLSVDMYQSNDGVRNAVTRNRFKNILLILHFTDNQTADKSGKAYKIRIAINHINKAFQDAMSDVKRQAIDELMTKFNGRLSCKQYIKPSKSIKWGFKWWYRCCSKTGYLCEFDLHLRKKEETDLRMGKTVVFGIV